MVTRVSRDHKTGANQLPVRPSNPSLNVSWISSSPRLVWINVVRMIALNITKVAFLLGTRKPFSVFRHLRSQTHSCCLLSVDVFRLNPRYMSSEPKKVRTENMTAKKIGTHNGTFHCDEVLACFLLRQLPEYKVSFTAAIRWTVCCSPTPSCFTTFFN